MRTQHKWLAISIILGILPMNTQAAVRALVKEVDVSASADEVWAAWTTQSGIKAFFARAANVELRPGGDYEILFFPDNPAGQRGAEGTVLLAVEPHHRIAFTWDAPPKWPNIRSQRTVVSITLTKLSDTRTRVRLEHMGWGEGTDWNQVYDYFDGAWSTVLKRLQYRYDNGPIDWDNVPAGLLYKG